MKAWKTVLAALLMPLACAPRNPPDVISTEYSYKPANAFEEAFVRRDGVRPIKFGGWIQSLREGTGASPNPDNVVAVHYRGMLTDGTEFDSSYARGERASFSLRNVIRCWTFGVPMMKVGGKAKLVCPPSAAYGSVGAPPTIPGGATLAFEIELLEIVK